MTEHHGKWIEDSGLIEENNDPQSTSEWTLSAERVHYAKFCLFLLCTVLCLATCIFGVTTWIMIKKWRKFRHYVFLNVFLVCVITMTCYYYVSRSSDRVKPVIYFCLVLARNILCHWLFVATVVFYLVFVKVFNADINRRYLWGNLFGWLLPSLEVVTLFAFAAWFDIDPYWIEFLSVAILLLILFATAVLYLTVLCELIGLAARSVESKKDVCQKIILCTAAFITSGMSSCLPVIVAEIVKPNDYVLTNPIRLISLVHIIIVVIFFLSMKCHRDVWVEYWRQRRLQRLF